MCRLVILVFSLLLFYGTGYGQQKCFSYENELLLQEKHPERATTKQFEDWMSIKLVEGQERRLPGPYVIPIIFHIIHDGEPVGTYPNLDAIWVTHQVNQINIDFSNGAGSTEPAAADTDIQFCLALEDPNGNLLPEPGINRINRNSVGWTAPPYGTCTGGDFGNAYIENTIKVQSYWNPNQYFNVWSMEMVCGILGYAQFPNSSGLAGIDVFNGGASTDGCVVLPNTLGAIGNAQPGGWPYNKGRTLTHEAGHWLGLRHIWGDSNCGNDYCGDTPTQQTASSGCPTTSSCGSVDMTRNYMDYSNDSCMDVYTQNQADRMEIVMTNSGRRGILNASTVCSTAGGCGSMITLSGNQSGIFDQESSDYIESTQQIQAGASVDYDIDPTIGNYIQLNAGFESNANADFFAFIDGCDNGAGGLNVLGEIGDTKRNIKERKIGMYAKFKMQVKRVLNFINDQQAR